ncbi:hypothetical protein CDL15_Pgr024865 [Punica granatum]|uniref:Uncharacterized protein n=1 Tax=Punica granatum TaxID=22663 RepID=A0A218Y3Z7_PUNGR|nr:hypothetical protein CDL15_Pgr024865 [Punica granatum]
MWTRSPWTRSPESSKCGREVRKAVKMDSKYWTRSPESSKYCGCYAVGTWWLASISICRTIKNLLDNGIRYAAVKALICRRLVSLLGRLLVCWGCPSLVIWDSSSRVERLRTPRDRESESAVVLAFVVPVILTSLVSHGITSDLGLDARPPGLPLALHGHIETFSKVPKRLYRLFDAPVSLGPFSSGCRRAAAFVTRMGNFLFKFGQTSV